MRRKRIYRLTLEDESRLYDMWHVSMSRNKLVIIAITGFFIVLAFGVLVVMLTPLHTLLPGYMKKSERLQTQSTLIRLDSIRSAYEANEMFLNNMISLLDTDRIPNDSTKYSGRPLSEPIDSFIGPSGEEREFVKMMEDREKYNISVLAPAAADGLIFSFPVPDGVVSESTRQEMYADIYVPSGSPVMSVSDGVVIDMHYSDPARSFVVVVQHRKGFMSKYIGILNPICHSGQRVIAGDVLSLMSNKSSVIRMELWRNGDCLVPVQYIGWRNAPDPKYTESESPLSISL